MKILQITNYYYPHLGGIEQVTHDIADSIPSNIEQKIICFNHEKGTITEEIDGVEVKRVGCFIKVASQSLSTCYGKELKKTVKEFKPDVIIFHYPNPFVAHFLLKALKKESQIKLVVYWHLDIVKQKILKLFFSGQNKRLLKRANIVVATSPNYIEGSKNLLSVKNKCTVIPNCADESRILPTENDKAFGEKIREENKDKIICFALGRHVPYKGMEYLVRASKLLPDNYKIYIAGKGELTESLIKLNDGDTKVVFTGKISDDELKGYLFATDIFCFPSITKNEAFGLALAEAMLCGKPSITFTVEGSGINYVSLDKITGIEVENRNYQEYAKAIETLGLNESLRKAYGEKAKERAEQLFTKEKFKENIKNLIVSIRKENK